MLLNESNCVGVPNSFQDFLEFDNKAHELLFPLHVRFFLHSTDYVVDRFSIEIYVASRIPIGNYCIDRFSILNYFVNRFPIENYIINRYPAENYVVDDSLYKIIFSVEFL